MYNANQLYEWVNLTLTQMNAFISHDRAIQDLNEGKDPLNVRCARRLKIG